MRLLNRKNALVIVAVSLCAIADELTIKQAISAGPGNALQQAKRKLGIPDETDVKAPVDYGAGPGVPARADLASASQIPVGGSNANVAGVFGPAVTWPIIPIHVVLLPGGRVMNYGTDDKGQQGAQLIYDVWNPSTNAHLVLPNTTSTDLFCSSQSVMGNGNVLTTGGDLTVNGTRNFANNKTTVFSQTTNTIASNTPMHYPRWYNSLVALPDGRLAVFGGYQNVVTFDSVLTVPTPEVYDPATKVWTSLTGATSDAAFGSGGGGNNWYYPRCYVAPGGNVFVLGNDGSMYSVSTAGVGGVTQLAPTVPMVGAPWFPAIPFAPGKLLSVRYTEVFVVDYTHPVPVVTQTDNIDQTRYWASGTILADGKVLVTGGSDPINDLTGVVSYQAEIWDPATGHWTAGASATKPRLYHSNSLLLSDASVLTAGGGAPGPVNNLNAEIYYPPYLYANDGSGQPAVRPVITTVKATSLRPGKPMNITVGPTDNISRLTFVRTGSATHSNNSDQRFINLPFSQTGRQLATVLPSDPTVLLPGYYMVFAFNTNGVPSTAQILFVSTK